MPQEKCPSSRPVIVKVASNPLSLISRSTNCPRSCPGMVRLTKNLTLVFAFKFISVPCSLKQNKVMIFTLRSKPSLNCSVNWHVIIRVARRRNRSILDELQSKEAAKYLRSSFVYSQLAPESTSCFIQIIDVIDHEHIRCRDLRVVELMVIWPECM